MFYFLGKTSTVEDGRPMTEVQCEVSEGETIGTLADSRETLRAGRVGADLTATPPWLRFQTSNSKYQSISIDQVNQSDLAQRIRVGRNRT